MSRAYQYTVYLNGNEVEQDYGFDSRYEAESEAGFAIETLLQCGYEDKGYRESDFVIEVREM